jgi:hypothetical protein
MKSDLLSAAQQQRPLRSRGLLKDLRTIRFLNAERSPKCGDQPNCEQQGRGPTDKVPGHFSFTPFLFEGLPETYWDDLRPSPYDDLAFGLTPY